MTGLYITSMTKHGKGHHLCRTEDLMTCHIFQNECIKLVQFDIPVTVLNLMFGLFSAIQGQREHVFDRTARGPASNHRQKDSFHPIQQAAAYSVHES